MNYDERADPPVHEEFVETMSLDWEVNKDWRCCATCWVSGAGLSKEGEHLWVGGLVMENELRTSGWRTIAPVD